MLSSQIQVYDREQLPAHHGYEDIVSARTSWLGYMDIAGTKAPVSTGNERNEHQREALHCTVDVRYCCPNTRPTSPRSVLWM